MTTPSCTSTTTCEDSCTALYDCLIDEAESRLWSTTRAAQQQDASIAACIEQCGGAWQEPDATGKCVAATGCSDIPGSCTFELLPDSNTSIGDGSGPSTDIPHGLVDPVCTVLARQPFNCSNLDSHNRQECLRVQALVKRLKHHQDEECFTLDSPWKELCLALGEGPESCRHLPAGLSNACREFHVQEESTDLAHLFQAVHSNSVDHCNEVTDARDRGQCLALLTHDDNHCQRELSDEMPFMASAGKSFLAPRPPPQPAFTIDVSAIYAVLSLLPLFLLGFIVWWLFSYFRELAGFPYQSLLLFAGTIGVFILIRLTLVAEGPINFVAYERIIPPGPDDTGRLGYAFFSLILRQIFMVTGSSLEIVFTTNLILAVIGLFTFHSLVYRLTSSPVKAGICTLVLGCNPIWLRLSGSASETLLFSVLAIMMTERLLAVKDRPGAQWSLLILVPCLLTTRPEGFFTALIFIGFGAGGWQWRGIATRTVAWPRLSLLIPCTGLLYTLAAVYQASLSLPVITGGLVLENAYEFLGEVVHPSFNSPFLVLLFWFTIGWLLWKRPSQLAGPQRAVRYAGILWMSCLLLLWSVQGAEGNLVLGSSRYLVILIPWLIILPMTIIAPRWVSSRRAASMLIIAGLLAYLPQSHIITTRSNIQQEYQLLMDSIGKLPAASLLIMPAQTGQYDEYTPHNAPLTMLSLADRKHPWIPADSFDISDLPGEGGEEVPPSTIGNQTVFLWSGFPINVEPALEDVSGCSLRPFATKTLVSVPDVAMHAWPAVGTEVTIGWYSLSCANSEISPDQRRP